MSGEELDLELDTPGDGWTYRPTKLYGWLIGLAFSVFGGLLCGAPIGAVIGLPVVAVGIFLGATFSTSLSSTKIPLPIAMLLLAVAISMVIIGRIHAPIDLVIESFRQNQSLVKETGFFKAFAFPLVLFGIHSLQMVAPWVRAPRRLPFGVSGLSVALIQIACGVLLIGAILTTNSPIFLNQPYWVWLAVPILFFAGVAMRGTPWYIWLLVLIMTASVLPLAWVGLTR